MKLQKFENELLNCKIGLFINDSNDIYFRAKDVASFLTYENTNQFINNNVDDDDKNKLEELWKDCSFESSEKNSIYINECGLYTLISKSNKDESIIFKKWITSEVLPSIRKTGKYATTIPINNQISIMNEKDLHYNIVKFIKNIIHDPIIIPGLGEHQTSSSLRSDAYYKGYISGVPDILILNYHKHYNGLAIELKTPKGNGSLTENQEIYLNRLSDNNFKVIVSNDYNNIILELIEYKKYLMYKCKYCSRFFHTPDSRSNHYRYFHKQYTIYQI
jgi:prophage antirepressor-like protein